MGNLVGPPEGGTPNEIVTRKFYFVHGFYGFAPAPAGMNCPPCALNN
jgi:hypothetical protein